MYEIRIATLDDMQHLIKYRIDLIKEVGHMKIGSISKDLEKELEIYFKANLGSKFMCWVAVSHDIIVAISGLNILEKPPTFRNLSGLEGYIMNIYVKEEYRGQGIATDLMKNVLNYVDQKGIKEVKLIATDKGKSIYEKLGFEEYKNGMELHMSNYPNGFSYT